jgi:HSP20 family molecular chaperone IbpA
MAIDTHHKHYTKPEICGDDFSWRPNIDFYQAPWGWVVKIELAGIAAHDVELFTVDNTLTISGQRRDYYIESDWVHIAMEILYSTFERTIEFPDNADMATLSWQFSEGLLMVKIAKRQG